MPIRKQNENNKITLTKNNFVSKKHIYIIVKIIISALSHPALGEYRVP